MLQSYPLRANNNTTTTTTYRGYHPLHQLYHSRLDVRRKALQLLVEMMKHGIVVPQHFAATLVALLADSHPDIRHNSEALLLDNADKYNCKSPV